MAMYVSDNKLYIFVADSDAINSNRIKGTNSDAETGNYCPPESAEQNQLFYNFLGNIDQLMDKPVYIKASKIREYKQKMTSRIKNKFSKIYNGEMNDFDACCDLLIASGNHIISNGMYLSGERPYLKFQDEPNWSTFKRILYSESTIIVLEDAGDRFYAIPIFHPLFIKPNEINWTIEEEQDEELRSEYDFICTDKSGVNLIVYGTPGCGKSYYVQHTLLQRGGYRCDEHGNCLDAIRTTFFQDYTNTDFVGQIMPVINPDKSVTYEFNPGPFTLALNKAIQNPDKPIALVIEELNRGNAASIFGDIFQLLDRENGVSSYNITNVNVQKYLEEQNPSLKFDYIKLPSNLSIFATMNTSDQNVFTLDTAFKRRWKFEKIKNTFLEDHKFKGSYIPGMDMDWEEFCNSINEFIVNDKNFINSEDKQLGVYFVDEKGLRKVQGDGSTEESRKEFAYKIFEYLWDDVAKYDREKWFNNIKTLDTLIDKYVDEGADDKSGINVFSDGIFKKK